MWVLKEANSFSINKQFSHVILSVQIFIKNINKQTNTHVLKSWPTSIYYFDTDQFFNSLIYSLYVSYSPRYTLTSSKYRSYKKSQITTCGGLWPVLHPFPFNSSYRHQWIHIDIQHRRSSVNTGKLTKIVNYNNVLR